ncbi:uncharacterized protein [Diadema setosum]|uniref:uncharacterized protein n=1 Tax=Diadema setosum TaxID=31175 RepID=UPI003B3B45C1
MRLKLTVISAILIVVIVATVDAGPGPGSRGRDRGPAGHNHGPAGHDHGPGRHDHGRDHTHDHGHRGHDHGPAGHGRGHDYGYDHLTLEPDHETPNEHDREERQVTVSPSLEPGRCTKIVSVTLTVKESYQATRKVATRTRCGWLHLAHCRKYRLAYELAYRQVTRLAYGKVRKCCPGFMEVDGVCEPLNGRTTPPTPSQSTTIIAPPEETTVDPVPHDDMMMMDDTLQKFVAVVIVAVAVFITGISIGGVVVYLCGGRKEVIRRISTRRFTRSKKNTTPADKGKSTHTKDSSDAPPRYHDFCKPTTTTTTTTAAAAVTTAVHYKKPTAPPHEDGYEDLTAGKAGLTARDSGKSGEGYLEFHPDDNPPVHHPTKVHGY